MPNLLLFSKKPRKEKRKNRRPVLLKSFDWDEVIPSKNFSGERAFPSNG